MKRLVIRTTCAMALALSAIGMSACLSDDDDPSGSVASFDATATLADFGEDVIVSIYQDLGTQADALETAVATFVATPNVDNLAAAQDAWRDTREPWELSEAFLFGPVDNGGYDPRLDSWPVNRVDLDAVLASQDAINDAFIDNQDDDRRGFHTIEYLLFDDGAGSRVAADIVAAFVGQARRGQYVEALCGDLADTAQALATAWASTGGNFVASITGAGNAGNALYPSQKSALLELLNGMAVIADEVANGKIADPFGDSAGNSDATLVESQFSYNSIEDFQNNIRGILTVWTGDYAGSTGVGIDAYVASRDAALSTRFTMEVNLAITAIGNINDPFRDAIVNDRANIQSAIDAVQAVFDTIENDLKPLVNSGTFEK